MAECRTFVCLFTVSCAVSTLTRQVLCTVSSDATLTLYLHVGLRTHVLSPAAQPDGCDAIFSIMYAHNLALPLQQQLCAALVGEPSRKFSAE